MEWIEIRHDTCRKNTENWHIMKPTKVYYSIREVRQLTELPAATLRYWEQQFDQLSPYKDEHGNRYYSEKDIFNLFNKIYILLGIIAVTVFVLVR